MKKKGGSKRKKRRHKRKQVHHKKKNLSINHPNDERLEKVLVENFVSLQKVMTNLSVKFDNLTNQISKLLELFEISAKALVEKDFNRKNEDEDSDKIIEKIEDLLNQNKTIARGITLMHERIPEQPQGYQPSQIPRQMTPNQPGVRRDLDMNQYQKSISSDSDKINRLPKA